MEKRRWSIPLLTPAPVAERLGPDLPCYFETDVAEEARRALRRASGTGRPLGAADWVKALERSMGRTRAARPVGRPPAPAGMAPRGLELGL